MESLCALCEIGVDWYGFLYSWADNKKKSNLMLSVLPPGTLSNELLSKHKAKTYFIWVYNVSVCIVGIDVVPWLGKMENMGPKLEYFNFQKLSGQPSISSNTVLPAFPVKGEKKSYNATPTVWITAYGINTDVQKLLRHSKKLPEKNQQFFKVQTEKIV